MLDFCYGMIQGQKHLNRKLLGAPLRIALLAAWLTLGLTLTAGPMVAAAQSTAAPLQLLQAATGEITQAQPEQRWTFQAAKGQHFSLRMQASSGNLDPALQMLDAAGKVVATSVSASLRNATIDAFVAADAVIYTIRATHASGTSSGTYSLTVLPGFSFVLLNNPTSANSPLRLWREVNSVSHYADGKLELQLVQDSSYTWTATVDRFGTFKDLYMQADLHSQQANSYWEAGLVFRSAKVDGNLEFYIYFINSDGKWKLVLSQPGGLKKISDWTDLPAKPQNGTDANLAVLVKGPKFTLFYNRQPIGEVSDSTLTDAGAFGVAIGTGVAPNNNTQVRFDNILVTLPDDEAVSGPITVPEKLVNWQKVQQPVLDELQQTRLVPSAGKMGLEIKDKAFVTNNGALGIQYQPLAESLSFTDLVYSADVTWESSNDNTGCAMEVRAADDNNFTIVYFDRKGGYGIRQVSSKDGTPVAIYYLNDAIGKANKATNRVTIIAIGNNLIVYINGTLVGNLTVKQTTGGGP